VEFKGRRGGKKKRGGEKLEDAMYDFEWKPLSRLFFKGTKGDRL
jgi:hypothetical protein